MKGISFFFILVLLASCASHQPPNPDISEPLEAHLPQYQKCYRQSESYSNRVNAVVRIQFIILKDGSSTEHKIVSSGFKDKNFEECFMGEIKKIRFPPPKDGTEYITVNQPFRFGP